MLFAIVFKLSLPIISHLAANCMICFVLTFSLKKHQSIFLYSYIAQGSVLFCSTSLRCIYYYSTNFIGVNFYSIALYTCNNNVNFCFRHPALPNLVQIKNAQAVCFAFNINLCVFLLFMPKQNLHFYWSSPLCLLVFSMYHQF